MTPETGLVVPDPRVNPVPAGWWDSQVREIVAACDSWQQLNEYEGQLQAMANIVESVGGDALEFRKALRVVEARRGDLLGEPTDRGGRPSKTVRRAERFPDISRATKNAYRMLARYWRDMLYPYLLKETDPEKVTQARLLQLIYRKLNQDKLDAITIDATAPTFAQLYDVVVIDPPWPMEKIERTTVPEQSTFDYPTMTIDELRSFSLPTRADCHVWVWTTQRFLRVTFDLLEDWGLSYICTFVWHKPGGFQPFGLPQYNCEFALYARRGSPQFTSTKALWTCFTAPRGKHSEKPDAFYQFVRRVTDGDRIDIFSRRPIEGFDAWGNEAGGV